MFKRSVCKKKSVFYWFVSISRGTTRDVGTGLSDILNHATHQPLSQAEAPERDVGRKPWRSFRGFDHERGCKNRLLTATHRGMVTVSVLSRRSDSSRTWAVSMTGMTSAGFMWSWRDMTGQIRQRC